MYNTCLNKKNFFEKSETNIYIVNNNLSMPFQKGQSGNPNGRPPGIGNATSESIKATFGALLAGHEDKLSEALEQVYEKSPAEFLKFWIEISTRFVPQVSRQEVTGKDGEDFKPINIILPKQGNE
jgi:hypothetical protein